MNILTISAVNYQVNDQKILKDINLNIEENAFLAISGPSGSGKSTLLKLLAKMISASSGTIYYQDQDIESLDAASYRKEVSYCFQSATLFGRTIRDNLAFPYEIRNLPFDQDKALTMMHNIGLNFELTKPITELSGGEKQRIALIRNIIIQPRVLLLDEVTTGLDDVNKQIIWDWLKDLRDHKAITLVMVSHDDQELQIADQVMTITDGILSGGQNETHR